MRDTLYTRALARGAEIYGTTDELAEVLHVPHRSLERWMEGTPMARKAFLELLKRLVQHEEAGAASLSLHESHAAEPLIFAMGPLHASCARCGAHEFVPVLRDAPLRLTSQLACRACSERVSQYDLLARVANEVVYQSRTVIAARERRQAALYKRHAQTRRGRDREALL
jgi:hypothetical protein